MRNLILLAGLAVGAVVCVALWMDEGPVVTLVTTDDRGNQFETGLWIVEFDGASFLRASSPSTAWLKRIRALPEVELVSGDERFAYRASVVSDDSVRDSVNRAMAEKYGQVNRVLVLLRDHSDSVPVRLDPMPSQLAAPVREHADGASP